MSKKPMRSKRKRTRADYVRLIVFCAVIGGFLYTLVSQQLHLTNIRREKEQCEAEIALQEKEYERLEQKAKYNSSKDFYEEKARDEGYVRSDETVFIVGN